jgi:hypothetical protein
MRRPALLLLVPFPLAGAQAPRVAAPADPGRFALAADAEARWIPFELTPGNQVRFDMRVDGRPATAILDTGVSLSLLSDRFAGLDAKAVRPIGRASAIGGTVPIGAIRTSRVELGAVTRTEGELVVGTIPAAATGSAEAVDLLVGRDLLERYALDIDYPNKRFRLLTQGRLAFTGATAPLTVSPERRVYESRVTLGARRLAPIVVDTGDGSPLTVTRAAWSGAGVTGAPVTTAVLFGLGGRSVTELAIVPELQVGRLAASEVEVRIEPPRGLSETIGVAGRIGSGFLGRYRVLLDPGAGRMVFQPGPQAGAPPTRSTSGLLLGALPDRLRVLHVMRGGPGAAAGWKDGDTICAVDGEKITPAFLSGPNAGWTAGAPGRVVKLTPCSGAERSLTLRRFY